MATLHKGDNDIIIIIIITTTTIQATRVLNNAMLQKKY